MVVDPRFMEQMGSPYLLAHGLGKPVANAKTEVEFPETGVYHVWVRTKDWVPAHHPGRFKVLVNGRELTETFGANGRDWSWQTGGQIEVATKKVTIELRDLTGFDGRCDAIYFATDKGAAPLFVDATGDGWIGFWAGAEFRRGRESYREFNESLAPDEADNRTHGNSVVFQTVKAKYPAAANLQLAWVGHIAARGEHANDLKPQR